MFRISDFSRLTRVSIKTLRHYDRLGLLVPARVDDRTRYRSYSARQLPRLQRILALRELGFSLEHISELLKTDRTGRLMRRMLEMRRGEAERVLESSQRRVVQIVALLRDLEEAPRTASPEIVLQPLPPVRVASRRARMLELDDSTEELFEELEASVARSRARAPGPPLLLYHDRDHRDRDADVEAAVPIVPGVTRVERASVRTLEAVPMAACVTYTGGYDQWGGVLRGLLTWLERRHLAPAGPVREAFVQFAARPGTSRALPPEFLAERAEEFVTEMQIPVRTLERPRAPATASRSSPATRARDGRRPPERTGTRARRGRGASPS